MRLLTEIFLAFIRKSTDDTDRRSNYIFYKIADSTVNLAIYG